MDYATLVKTIPGYAGWGQAEAMADYAATGGAGKGGSSSGGGASSGNAGGFVGGIDESQLPSTLDYVEKLNASEDVAFKDLVMAMKARKSPLDVYNQLETESGLPQLRGSATSLAKEIGSLEDTLATVEPDISARSRESLMTEAQKRGVVTATKEPMLERLGKFTTNLGRMKDLIGLTESNIGTKTQLYGQGQEQQIEPLKLQYTALVDRNARNLSGFTSDKQTKLEILMDKLNRQRQLSDMEWQQANVLSSEERQYKKQLQTTAASAGYKVAGNESNDQLLTMIGTKAAEQIAFTRNQALKGTSEERSLTAARTAIKNDVANGATFEDINRRYSDKLQPYEIRQIYNASSRYGPARETEAQTQQWRLSPETVYKTEASAKEKAGKMEIVRPDGSVIRF